MFSRTGTNPARTAPKKAAGTGGRVVEKERDARPAPKAGALERIAPLRRSRAERAIGQVAGRAGHGQLVRIPVEIVPEDGGTVGVAGAIESDFDRTRGVRRHRIGHGIRFDGPLRFVARHEPWCELAQPLHVDPSRAGNVVEREIERGEIHPVGERLVPAPGRVRGGHELAHDGPARGLESGERVAQVVGFREARDQGERVLHGEPRAGTDGEMRGMRRVTEQHPISRNPLLAPQPRKPAPMGPVGHQRRPLKDFGEDLPARTGRSRPRPCPRTRTVRTCRANIRR